MVLVPKHWKSRSSPGIIADGLGTNPFTISKKPLPVHTARRLFRLWIPSRRHTYGTAGWSSPVARQAHNLKVVGSNPTPATTTNKGSANRQSPFFMPPVITRETEAPGTEAPGISGCALQIKGASGRSGNLADFVYHVPKLVVLIIDYFSRGSVTPPNENDRDRCRGDQGSSDCPRAFRTW